MSRRTIKELINGHAADLLAMDGVEGVYEGLLEDGRPCIKVALKKRSESLEKTIAELFPDCPLVFIDTGEVGPHADHGEAGLSS